MDKVKNSAAHKVTLFGEVRGLVERFEQAPAELQQTDEAAREKFVKVIADWLRKEGIVWREEERQRQTAGHELRRCALVRTLAAGDG